MQISNNFRGRFAIGKLLLLAFVTIGLAGCFSVKLVPDYDAQIDRGLTELYRDTTLFVDEMIAKQGTSEGAFEANQEFHRDAAARIATLVARAQANQVLDNCPSTQIMDRALASAGLPPDVTQQIGTLPQGGCELVLLRLVEGGFRDFQRFHSTQGENGIPASARGPLLEGGVGALLRAAMAVEIAKQTNE